MELENQYQGSMRIGDPTRNKFAIASFVISLCSIILTPLIIPQILGIIFAALGLKSEKRGLSTAGLVINIITILMGIIAVVSIGLLGGIVHTSKIKADQDMTVKIQNAIVSYINDTKDIDLKFGGDRTPDIKEVFLKLQDKITVDGKECGPYLNRDSGEIRDIKPQSSDYKGWEVSINKDTGTVEVKLSKTGDFLVIK